MGIELIYFFIFLIIIVVFMCKDNQLLGISFLSKQNAMQILVKIKYRSNVNDQSIYTVIFS